MLFLNISSPHKIYARNVSWTTATAAATATVQMNNGLSVPNSEANNQIGQLFTQCNGQIIEMSSERIGIKSVWEYFINKD